MAPGLEVDVSDVVGHLEKKREFSGSEIVDLRLGDTRVAGAMRVVGVVRGTTDGVHSTYSATARAALTCVRCLRGWSDTIDVSGSQHFSLEPDEDGYGVSDGQVDMAAPARDELALALPSAPLCMEECKGLCPICGTDLNNEPCDGHGDDSDSPFSVLKDLFDSP